MASPRVIDALRKMFPNDAVALMRRSRASAPADLVARLNAWTYAMGSELKPHAPWHDSFGDGVRYAKSKVAAILGELANAQPAPESVKNLLTGSPISSSGTVYELAELRAERDALRAQLARVQEALADS